MKKTTLFLLFCLLSNLAFSQKKLPEDLVQSIQKRIEFGHTPSVVVGIIDKDGPQYYAFGTKTIGGKPVNEHTIYEIGSISKTFTAILLAQMVQEGKLKTDDAAQNYLPAAVKLPIKDGKQITLGHLSDHTSGLPRMPDNFAPKDLSNPYADYSVELMYDYLNNYALTRDIGSAMEYSNLAAGLLGHILSLKSGMSYEDLVVHKIALPLGMEATKITFDEAMRQNLAMGHSNGVQVPNWDIPTLAGAGAIRSSLYDMLQYVAANLGLEKTNLQAALQLTHQPRHDKTGSGARVGLGWIISKGEEGDIFWHNGGTGGYRTFAGFVKETGKGVVVLTNSDRGADDIGFRLLNSTAKLIEVKKSGVAAIKEALETQGLATALKTYDELKKDKATYEFGEDAINSLGYTYMGNGKMAEALALFKIYVDEYPKSFNAYDSYAEALMKDGQKEAAIVNYKKSLELNPNNVNARDMLAKMGAAEPVKAMAPEESAKVIQDSLFFIKTKGEFLKFEQSHGHYIQTENVKMHYLTWGKPTGTPIVWAHGTGSDAYEMLGFADSLAKKGCFVISIDYYGHGFTPIPEKEVSLYHVADDIAFLLDDLKIKKAIIGGWSRGGSVATAFYDAYPERVLGLILEDGGSVAWVTNEHKEPMDSVTVRFTKLLTEYAAFDTMTFASEFKASRQWAEGAAYNQKHIFQTLASLKKNAAGRWAINPGLSVLCGVNSVEEVLTLIYRPFASDKLFGTSNSLLFPKLIYRHLNVPTLILDPVSDKDQFVFEAENAKLQQAHPDFITHKVYKETSHALKYERPDEFLKDVNSLIAKVKAFKGN